MSVSADSPTTPSRIALVTGAGSGIGRAPALALSQAGWQVYLLGRREATLQATQALCAPQSAHVLVADVTQPEQVQAAFARIAQEAGRLDLLFNNAGMGAPAVPLEDLDPAKWREVVDVNLSGMFYCIQAAFRQMKSQSPMGGRIINNGSISATPQLDCLHRHQARGIGPDQSGQPRWPQVPHRRGSDRRGQCRHRHDRTHGSWHLAGQWPADGRAAHVGRRGGPLGGLHGQPTAHGQRAVPHGDGDQHAAGGAWLRAAP